MKDGEEGVDGSYNAELIEEDSYYDYLLAGIEFRYDNLEFESTRPANITMEEVPVSGIVW